MGNKKVTKIDATIKIASFDGGIIKKRRVAAYARVSTAAEEQETSLAAQRDYYEQYIKENKEWEFVGIYYDDGISGLSFRNRDGFNRMIKDALDGKIDLILTKSLSRFARNTVDTLTTIRKLKAANIEVYFEKENIFTLDSKGEFLITIMSSIAQEESRSISENVTWGTRKRFSDGKYHVPYDSFLGYEKGTDGSLQIVEKEAAIVRLIYLLYLAGKSPHTICELFNALEIPTTKQQGPWNKTPVVSILTNEKYKGDALLQKTITIDFLTGKRKINEGEVTQYYVSNAHDPIVSAEVFEMVQNALKYRRGTSLRFSGFYPLGGRVFCSSCGSFFGHKILQRRRNGRLTRKEIWRCNSYYDGNAHPHSIKDSQMVDGLAAALQTAIDSNMDVVDLCWETMKAIHPRLQRPKYDKIIRSIYEDANRTRKNILFLHFVIDKVVVSDGLHLTFYLKDGTQIEYN